MYLRYFYGYPSVPQVFINGELIGGSDKMAEYVESGKMDKLYNWADKLNL